MVSNFCQTKFLNWAIRHFSCKTLTLNWSHNYSQLLQESGVYSLLSHNCRHRTTFFKPHSIIQEKKTTASFQLRSSDTQFPDTTVSPEASVSSTGTVVSGDFCSDRSCCSSSHFKDLHSVPSDLQNNLLQANIPFQEKKNHRFLPVTLFRYAVSRHYRLAGSFRQFYRHGCFGDFCSDRSCCSSSHFKDLHSVPSDLQVRSSKF
ncbi:hypothetical protein JHK82_053730 [Glycine max]|nr:hypothetical protein JHK82_053730 [Glycine max]